MTCTNSPVSDEDARPRSLAVLPGRPWQGRGLIDGDESGQRRQRRRRDDTGDRPDDSISASFQLALPHLRRNWLTPAGRKRDRASAKSRDKGDTPRPPLRLLESDCFRSTAFITPHCRIWYSESETPAYRHRPHHTTNTLSQNTSTATTTQPGSQNVPRDTVATRVLRGRAQSRAGSPAPVTSCESHQSESALGERQSASLIIASTHLLRNGDVGAAATAVLHAHSWCRTEVPPLTSFRPAVLRNC